MKKIAFFCLIFLFSLAGAFAAQSREALTLPAAGCRALDIECGAGSLKVLGDDKLDRIEVDALLVVRGISESDLPEYKKHHVTLKLEKSGDRALLKALINEKFSLENLFGGREAHIDLHVRLPRGLALAVDDGSGDMAVRDMASGLEINDGSGDITLDAIAGPVKIVDGSGDARLTGIKGDVEIEDGSGCLDLSGLEGRVEIEDGSGDIELKDAGGDVSIDDGSGQIDLGGIRGSVTIDDGSGDIVIDGVEKDVTIEEAGSGDLEITNVKGRVRK